MIRFIGALLFTTMAFATPVSALPFLVGTQIYASGADGTNEGAYSGPDYQFSTNSSVVSGDLFVNGQPITSSFALALGDNAFTFDPVWVDYPINTVGLNLFFNLSGVSFNPVYEAGVGIPGNLSAFTVANSGLFSVPVAGTNVQAFNSSSVSTISTSYSGAGAFRLDDWDISIVAFESGNVPSGSFTIRVANVPVNVDVPEPSTMVLLGLGLAGLVFRRKKAKAV